MKLSKFNELTKWSNLSRLASGNLPKLTIIAPFVAFIILHNDPLQPMLELSENRHPNPVVAYLAAARFDIFYLGLIVVGLSVALFTVFCPKQVSGYVNYEDFIEQKERTATPNGIAGSLRLTLEKLMADASAAEPDLDEAGVSRKFPRRVTEAVNALFSSVVTQADLGDGGLVDDRGEPQVGRILAVMHHRSANERASWQRLYEALVPSSIDVFRLEYLAADYAAPNLRGLIFWLLCLGIATMLIPTFITTFLVLSDLWTAADMSTTAP